MDSAQEAINTLLQEGIALARTGKKAAARERVRQATRLAPTNAVVWLCRAGLAEDRDEAGSRAGRDPRSEPSSTGQSQNMG